MTTEGPENSLDQIEQFILKYFPSDNHHAILQIWLLAEKSQSHLNHHHLYFSLAIDF